MSNIRKSNKLTIMVGLPRSGKTTWVLDNMKDRYIISADLLRQQIHGSEFYAPAEQLVWSIRRYILMCSLEQGVDIVIDETNMSVSKRIEIIQFAKKYNYIIDCVYVETPLEICLKRTNNEKLKHVINKMNSYFEMPLVQEGFTHIHIVK